MMTPENPRATAAPRPGQRGAAPAPLARSPEIAAAHLEKLAVVYVRQSSPQQVLENRESTARQYALAGHAAALGWPEQRVLLIDEDQGHSGRAAAGRPGFQRLLAGVTMDHVGIILGLEMSRLARADSDWHRLVELCGVFGTLLADQDGVYDAADPNDRLLLGLKGTISSVELTTMRNRLERGRLFKAQRGELFSAVPLGYVVLRNGKVDLDPDEQVRSVVRLLFEKFEELGSARSLLRWLLRNGIDLPMRLRTGASAGQLEWRRPCPTTLLQVLHSPIYAGAYAYGRRPADPKRQYATGKGRGGRWRPMDQWHVLIRDHLPAYITWERYLRNLERLKQNQQRPNTLGAPRNGCALLGGLVTCERRGWRMQVCYHDRGRPYYRCMRHHLEGTGQPCFSVSADVLDRLVGQQVLGALEPAALELSLQAQADARQERARLGRHWQQRLQRARYDAELAERRYRAVDPAHRLVAATLERQWEEALRACRQVHEEYDRFARQALPQLGAAESARIAALSADIPALWGAPRTTNADRQAILRCLVQRVVVRRERGSERVTATIHWAGGHVGRLQFARPVRAYAQLSGGEALLNRVVELHDAGHTAARAADVLNAEGFLPIDPRERFDGEKVRGLLLKAGLRGEQHDPSQLREGEWWLSALAEEIGMPWRTLREWAVSGWVHWRRTKVQKLWVVWADQEEVRRLGELRAAGRPGSVGYPPELKSPKKRPEYAGSWCAPEGGVTLVLKGQPGEDVGSSPG
jgi:DNA invertase Pin-like site-specific DNA recombinase